MGTAVDAAKDSALFEGGRTVLEGPGGTDKRGSTCPPGWRTGCPAAAAA